MKNPTRRGILETSVVASAALLGLPLVADALEERKRLKVVVVGGHPDDPESAAGGTMARMAGLGHEVVALYLTRGEAGIRGKTHEQSAAIRSAEAKKACEILKARPVFAGQIDGATELSNAHYDAFARILLAEKPDIVLTHWPVDTHRDHRAASLLGYDAFLRSGQSFALYYFEVLTGSQTQSFHPTHYVDISEFEGKKREACFAHASQNPPEFYGSHSLMNQFRGMERGVKFAEGFVRHEQGKGIGLP
jgi:LmbE family N-acetylglucosaminyl deacetylase